MTYENDYCKGSLDDLPHHTSRFQADAPKDPLIDSRRGVY